MPAFYVPQTVGGQATLPVMLGAPPPALPGAPTIFSAFYVPQTLGGQAIIAVMRGAPAPTPAPRAPTYAILPDMVLAFGAREVIALSDRDHLGVIDEDVVDGALEEATAEIDGYLAGRYALPLLHVPKPLVRICCNIARYHLAGAEVTETDAIRLRYKDAVRTLEAIRDAKMTLGLDTTVTPVPSAGGVRVVGGTRTFSRTTLADY